MPELPEVQTIINDLNKKVLNLPISSVYVGLKKIVKNSEKVFKKLLINNSFKRIKRRGKFIIFELNKQEKYLLVHLRMTGQIIYQDRDKVIAGGHSTNEKELTLPNKHTHIILEFINKSKLFYNDQRQFGIMQIVDDEELNEISNSFGIEPLSKEFTFSKFLNLLLNKNTNIKAFLLNQKYIVGIGNIYADEILYRAHVQPVRNVNSIKVREAKKIFESIKMILKSAIKSRGTTFNDYVDADGNKGNFFNKLNVYHRSGKECKKCKNILLKIKVAGRGTTFCSKCQK